MDVGVAPGRKNADGIRKGTFDVNNADDCVSVEHESDDRKKGLFKGIFRRSQQPAKLRLLPEKEISSTESTKLIGAHSHAQNKEEKGLPLLKQHAEQTTAEQTNAKSITTGSVLALKPVTSIQVHTESQGWAASVHGLGVPLEKVDPESAIPTSQPPTLEHIAAACVADADKSPVNGFKEMEGDGPSSTMHASRQLPYIVKRKTVVEQRDIVVRITTALAEPLDMDGAYPTSSLHAETTRNLRVECNKENEDSFFELTPTPRSSRGKSRKTPRQLSTSSVLRSPLAPSPSGFRMSFSPPMKTPTPKGYNENPGNFKPKALPANTDSRCSEEDRKVEEPCTIICTETNDKTSKAEADQDAYTPPTTKEKQPRQSEVTSTVLARFRNDSFAPNEKKVESALSVTSFEGTHILEDDVQTVKASSTRCDDEVVSTITKYSKERQNSQRAKPDTSALGSLVSESSMPRPRDEKETMGLSQEAKPPRVCNLTMKIEEAGQRPEKKDVTNALEYTKSVTEGAVAAPLALKATGKPRTLTRKVSHHKLQSSPATSKNACTNSTAPFFVQSAASIPIQTAARRYLARREASIRTVSIITIQDGAREWLSKKCLREHPAAIKIQAAIRGRYVRLVLDEQHRHATEIQSHVRRYMAESMVFETISCIIIAQSVARKKMASNTATSRLTAIIKIQSWNRGLQVRRLALNAILIQTRWRRYFCRSEYVMEMNNIIIIQSIVRRRAACKVSDQKHHELLMRKATKIQTAWRRYSAWSFFMDDVADVVIVQSVVRRKAASKASEQMKHEKLTRSATRIQTAWRSYSAWSNFMDDFGRIITVQSVARRKAASKASEQMKHEKLTRNATRIQTAWRCYSAWSYYEDVLTDIILVQAVARRKNAYKALEQKRHDRRTRKATRIQAAWRCYSAWSRFVDDLTDIITVESVIRRKAAYKLLQQKRRNRNATRIQTAWRCYSAWSYYEDALTDIILVQAVARRKAASKASEQLKKLTRNATRIQTAWRCFSAWSRFVDDLTDITIIQSAFRRKAAHKVLEQNRQVVKSANLIQNQWRRHSAEKRLSIAVAAITIVQSNWRCYSNQQVYSKMQSATISIQQMMRMRRAFMTLKQKKHDRLAKNAVRIQAAWRCYSAWSHFMDEIADIITIQSVVRRKIACETLERSKELMRSAIQIQSQWRSYYCSLGYLCTRNDAILIQKTIRMHSAKKRLKTLSSAVLIQISWRKHRAMKSFRMSWAAAETIQTNVRRHQTEERFRRGRRGFIKLQASVRQRQVEKEQAALHTSAVIVQRNMRRIAAEQWYSEARASATFLQAALRRVVEERRYRCLLKSVIQCQSRARQVLAEEYFWRCLTSSVTIQSNYRRFRAQDALRLALLSATLIQAAVRGEKIRKPYHQKRQAATRIQANWRRYLVEDMLLDALASAVRIQMSWRMHFATKTLQRGLAAATKLQSAQRRLVAQTRYRSLQKSIILCQSIVRKQRAMKCRLKATVAVTLVASFWRRYSKQQAYRKMKSSAVMIQKETRRHLVGEWFEGILASTLLIQTSWRKRYRKRMAAATTIQSRWRGLICEVKYYDSLIAATIQQCYWRRYAAQIAYREKSASVVKLQSIFRGYIGRKACVQLRRIAKKRKRERDAAKVIQATFRTFSQRRQYKKMRERAPSFSIKARIRQINNLGLESGLVESQQTRSFAKPPIRSRSRPAQPASQLKIAQCSKKVESGLVESQQTRSFAKPPIRSRPSQPASQPKVAQCSNKERRRRRERNYQIQVQQHDTGEI